MDRNTKRILWIVAGAAVFIALVAHHNISEQDIILFCVIVPSIILHEISHGWVARVFGDRTAERAGRLTLNPMVHIDPVGTLIVPALLALGGFGVFGWAKPVPVNTANLRSPRNEGVLVSLAGPFTNFLLAGAGALVFIEFFRATALRTGALSLPAEVVFYFSLGNIGLMAFNLVPIPPLDGSVVFERFLPARYWPTYLRIRPYTMMIILGLVFINFLFNPGPLTLAFQHLYDWWAGVLFGGP
ncbi:MAG: site-2 protease family protein [Acidimicrobiales bacterium]